MLSRLRVAQPDARISQLLLALTSCVLTIYLTVSTSFVTRKESGVLSPSFVAHDNKSTPPDTESKRKVLYYVGRISFQ